MSDNNPKRDEKSNNGKKQCIELDEDSIIQHVLSTTTQYNTVVDFTNPARNYMQKMNIHNDGTPSSSDTLTPATAATSVKHKRSWEDITSGGLSSDDKDDNLLYGRKYRAEKARTRKESDTKLYKCLAASTTSGSIPESNKQQKQKHGI